MGRRACFVALCVASLAVAMCGPVAAAPLELKPREVLAEFDFKKENTEMHVTLVRLAPGKLVAIVEMPVKTKAKIDRMYLKSPSGKQYRSKPARNVKIEDLDRNLDKIAGEGNTALKVFRTLDNAIAKDAWATCGSCGSGGGESRRRGRTGGLAVDMGAIFRRGLEASGGFAGLLEIAIEEEEEEAEWELFLHYIEERGAAEVFRGTFLWGRTLIKGAQGGGVGAQAPAATEKEKKPQEPTTTQVKDEAKGPDVLAQYQDSYRRHSERLKEIDPNSEEAKAIREALPKYEKEIRAMGGEVPKVEPAAEGAPRVEAPQGAPEEAPKAQPWASSTDPKTGITTTSQGNPDGSRTITKTDSQGNEVSRETVPPPGKSTPSVSTTDPATGETTTIEGLKGGGTVTTKTDASGKQTSKYWSF